MNEKEYYKIINTIQRTNNIEYSKVLQSMLGEFGFLVERLINRRESKEYGTYNVMSDEQLLKYLNNIENKIEAKWKYNELVIRGGWYLYKIVHINNNIIEFVNSGVYNNKRCVSESEYYRIKNNLNPSRVKDVIANTVCNAEGSIFLDKADVHSDDLELYTIRSRELLNKVGKYKDLESIIIKLRFGHNTMFIESNGFIRDHD